MKLWSLRERLMLLIVLLVAPLVVLELNTASEQRKRAAAEVRAEAIRLTRLVSANQQSLFESTRQLLMTLAQVDGVRRHSPAACASLLKGLLKQNRIYSNLGACDLSGNVFCSAIALPGSANLGNLPFFRRVVETGAFAIGEYEVGQVSPKPSVCLGYPVFDDAEKLQGVVFLAIDLQVASEFGTRVPFPPDATAMMASEQDTFLLRYPDPEKWIGQPAGNAALIRAVPAGTKEGVLEAVGSDRVKRVYAVERLELGNGQNLYVAVGIAREAAYAPFQRQLLYELGAITAIALAALAGAWFVGRLFIVQPARHLVGVARAVSAGDFGVRSTLGLQAGEFGEIGQAFNQMADTLAHRIAELNEVQHALRQAHDLLESRVERRTQELRRAREQLVDAIENIDAGFVMFGPDGGLVIWNETYRKMFEIDTGHTPPSLGYEQILRNFVKRGGRVAGFATMEEWIGERMAAYRIADGRNTEQRQSGRWVRVSDHRTRDGGVVLLRTDITDLKETQETLLLRNRAIAALNSAVIVTDPTLPENPIVDANPAFEQITGYSKVEALGRNGGFLLGPQSDASLVAAARLAIAEGRDWQGIVRNYRKDGTPFWCEAKFAPVRDGSGQLTHYVGVLTDVSERVDAEAALEHSTAELRRSNEELEQFAYVASHDLQEPLRMVASYTQLLARRYKDKLDQNGLDFIAYAVDGAQRMQAFIRDLLQYSRVGTHARPFVRLEVRPLLDRVLENLRLALEEKKARVVIGEMPVLEADPVQLSQLFQNLISNALKFSGEQPLEIEIAASRRDESEWEFTVRDNGIGIAPEDAERIFIIFQRLHSRQEYEGTGIGLALCKKIVERHGGRIWVEPAPGAGTVFAFTLRERQEEEAKS